MTEYKVRVSIIIPHWNGIDILSECLNSLANTKHNSYEIIVVDNASTDGSQSWVRNTYPQIKLIENDKNYGYAGGCNAGALEAEGIYLVFLNILGLFLNFSLLILFDRNVNFKCAIRGYVYPQFRSNRF